MSDNRTQVLFVPYRGSKNTKRKNGEISQQKHAAREYHRKAKLKRQALGSKLRLPDTIRSKSTSSEPRSGSSTTVTSFTSSRSISPTSISSVSPKPHQPSPTSILGAGRVDPFDSHPVKDLKPCVHEMIDYALIYQWPIFRFVNPHLTYQDMKTQVAYRLRVSQTSFFCTIFAAATHFALSRVGQEAPSTNLMLRLDYKARSLKMMLGNVTALGKDMPDEILHAIFALASYGTAERVSSMTTRDLKNPLATAFDLDIYSRIPAEHAHVRALSHLLKERGGLRTIKRPGFAAVVGLYDVFISFRKLEPPEFSLLQPTSHFVDEFRVEDDRVSRMCRPLQIVLQQLPSSPQLIRLRDLLQDVVAITLAYEEYEVFEPSAPTLHSILMARHCVLHDLLTVGDSTTYHADAEHSKWLPGEATLYDLTWLTVLSYMVLDLHPCARGPGPHELLAERLKSALVRVQEQDLPFHQPVLYQWANNLHRRLITLTI